jgi:hypothetical protein
MPLTGYHVFQSEKRTELKIQFPNATTNRINVELGRLWKDLDDQSRSVYEAQARELNVAYVEDHVKRASEIQTYMNNLKDNALDARDRLGVDTFTLVKERKNPESTRISNIYMPDKYSSFIS